jgi:hypothetical protein
MLSPCIGHRFKHVSQPIDTDAVLVGTRPHGHFRLELNASHLKRQLKRTDRDSALPGYLPKGFAPEFFGREFSAAAIMSNKSAVNRFGCRPVFCSYILKSLLKRTDCITAALQAPSA